MRRCRAERGEDMRDTTFELPVCGLAIAASAIGLEILASWAGLLF